MRRKHRWLVIVIIIAILYFGWSTISSFISGIFNKIKGVTSGTTVSGGGSTSA